MINNFLKVIIAVVLIGVSINTWAKDGAASIAVNYNTGAYGYDTGSDLTSTAYAAIRNCEKFAKQINKVNLLGFKEKYRKCEVVAQIEGRQCVTFASDVNGSFGWAILDGKYVRDNMRDRSLNQCRMMGGGNCRTTIELCTK